MTSSACQLSIVTQAKSASEIEISVHNVDQLIVEHNNKRLGIVRLKDGSDPHVRFDRATGILTISHAQNLELVDHRSSNSCGEPLEAQSQHELQCPEPAFLASPSLMRLVEITGKGRGFVSTASLTPGMLLSQERPFFKFSSITKQSLGSGITVAAEVVALAADTDQFDRVEKAVELLGFHPTIDTFQMVTDERLADVMMRLKAAIQSVEIFPTVDPQRLVRLLLQMECNSFYLGMLAYTAMFNHSCIPNATASIGSDGETMDVRAKRIITAGEEITISYQQDAVSGFPGLPFDTQAKRQKHLSRCYSFECTCECCLDLSHETEMLRPGGTAKHMESIREQTIQINNRLTKATDTHLLWKKAVALLKLAEKVLAPRNLCLYRAQALVRRIAVSVLNTISSRTKEDEVLSTLGVQSHREVLVLQTNTALTMLDTISHFADRKDKMALTTIEFLICHLQNLLMGTPDLLIETKLGTAKDTKTAINELITWRDEIQAAYS